MKKLLVTCAVVAGFVACKNNTEKTANAQATEKETPVVVQQESRRVSASQDNIDVQEKKGMSKAAKGAIIGGVGGAVVGGVATKSAKGAVVGGVVGGTAGYIIGRQQDKKDGRVQ